MIGKKRHRITFQEEVRVPDGAGGFSSDWQDIAADPVMWADIEPVKSEKTMLFSQLGQMVTHRIRIRHREDISSRLRVIKGSRIFRIRTVIDAQERGRWLEILAEEGFTG